MPLIDIKTDLKSLGYGNDKPYVTKDINNPPKYTSVGREVTARVDDVTRITKMFASANGIRFVAHEAMLNSGGVEQRIKKSRSEGKTLAGALLKEAGRTLVSSGKTVASLIAQTGVAGTGQHIIRGFEPAERYLDQNSAQSTLNTLIGNILPAGLGILDPGRGGSLLKIEGSSVLQDNRGEGYRSPIESGLVKRESVDDLKEVNPYTGRTGKGNTGVSSVNSALKSQATEIDVIDKSYTGFEGSTNSAVWRVQSDLEKKDSELNPEKDLSGTKAPKDSKVIDQATKVTKSYLRSKNQDAQSDPTNIDNLSFNKKYISELSGEANLMDKPSRYTNAGLDKSRIDVKYGTATSAVYDENTKTYTRGDGDKINLLGVNEDPSGITDIIPFKIKSVIAGLSDVQTKVLNFRAYLDSLDDSFTGDWSSYSYVGRGDKMYSYNGFERALNFSFKASADSKAELEPIYEKLNYLASMTAPTYADARFMRGTYSRITIGDYVSDLPVVIGSVGFTWDINVPWEIDDSTIRVPHMLSVSVQTKVIHDFTPTTTETNKYIGYNK